MDCVGPIGWPATDNLPSAAQHVCACAARASVLRRRDDRAAAAQHALDMLWMSADMPEVRTM